MIFADLGKEPSYESWAKVDVWPIGVAVELIVAHKAAAAKCMTGEEYDTEAKRHRSTINDLVNLGKDNGELQVDDYSWYDGYSAMNSMVAKDDFLLFVSGKGFPVSEMLMSSVKKPGMKPKPEQIAKPVCQGIARTLWAMDENKDMTIDSMSKHPAIQEFGGGNCYAERTVSRWVSEVDPRDPNTKTGRKAD